MSYEYPTDEQLDAVKSWDFRAATVTAWFQFIKTIWWMPDWGWHEYDGVDDFEHRIRVYHISTGGWSGNESIISAMVGTVGWMVSFYQHRRGGHYEFRVKAGE